MVNASYAKIHIFEILKNSIYYKLNFSKTKTNLHDKLNHCSFKSA